MDDFSGDLFKRDIPDYKLNLNPIASYIKQASKFIEKMEGIPYNQAIGIVKSRLKGSGIKDPIVKFRSQMDSGDREIVTDTLSNYLKTTLEKNEIMAPSFTTYTHPTNKKSLHSEFLNINLAKRKADKKNAFRAKQAGDIFKFNYFNTMQKTRKVANNSLSGAYASKSTILFNPSAHYTLTSITRSVASIGNAITESLVAGNKIFKTPENVINYITAIIAEVDMERVKYCITKYNLYAPTPDDVMVMIDHGSHWYWKDEEYREYIKLYLSKLEPYERAAVLYVNDMYHLRMYNDAVVREMFTKLSKRVETGSEDNLKDLNSAPEGLAILAHFIWAEDLRGMEVNYENMVGSEMLMKLASTTRNITEVFMYYRFLIRTFLTTDILPIDIANIKDTLRDVIVLSDTDSTCGSYEDWVRWYFNGPVVINSESIAIAAVIMTINTQVMDHNIKVFARNMNIDDSKMNTLAMKNEFFWPVFVPTNVSKHYYADVMIQEGNVFRENDTEIKGVHLIASNIDQELTKQAKEMMLDVFDKVKKGEKISLFDSITKVANIERSIINKLKAGDLSIYKQDKIKSAESYKQSAAESPYIHHLLWEQVFADKYGHAEQPTYAVIKVPTTLSSKKDTQEFLNNMENEDIKIKLQEFMTRYGKDVLGTFRLPVTIVSTHGVPEELHSIIDIERVIKDNCNVFYMILETLGGYRKPNRLFCQMGY